MSERPVQTTPSGRGLNLFLPDPDDAPVDVPAPFLIFAEGVGEGHIECFVRGPEVLRQPLLNKGTGFSLEERRALGLEGLLPARVNSLAEQVERAYAAYCTHPDDLTRHIFLRTLQERQEVLYYALITQHLEEMLPIVYTPTVGDSVRMAGRFAETTRGITLSSQTIDSARRIVAEQPFSDIRLVVATDSSAILGIGDQGAGGTEIAVGKLAIYTAAGGIAPERTLPATLDVGTDSSSLRSDPLYVGADMPRLRGDTYMEFVEKFVAAVWDRWPGTVIQWEDLSRDTAFSVLERFRDRGPSFNDDIQGTGAVVLAGILVAAKTRGETIADHRFVIHGAGAGGLGVAWALRAGLERAGLTAEQARRRVCVLDSGGLLVEENDMLPIKRQYAQSPLWIQGWSASGGRPTLVETVLGHRPTVLIGLSGVAGAFDREVIEATLEGCTAPIVMPLSNPTSHSEAIPADVIAWTNGRALVATGSPFAPVEFGGERIEIGQGNNAFIFPGLGHGAVIACADRVTDGMVVAAAAGLAEFTLAAPAWSGRMYPPIVAMPDAARAVAAAVIRAAVFDGVAASPATRRFAAEELVERSFWRPHYLPLVASS